MKINVHIERLILDGLPVSRAEGALVQTAVEVELTRLLAEGGLGREMAAGGTVPSVPANGISLVAGNDPQRIGRQIAGAVYEGLNR